MLCNIIKRGMIYGYLLFIGYQLLINLSANKQFTESVTKFETQHEKYFTQIYEKVPQLVQYKFAKYPAALIGFSALSVLIGGFGVFALASHALITYISNEKIVGIVKSINPKMDFVKFAQILDLDTILLLVLYLGVLCQNVYSIFGGCAARKENVQTVPDNEPTSRNTSNGSSKKKKHI